MITSRDLRQQPTEERQPFDDQTKQQEPVQQLLRDSVTVRRKVQTPSGSMHSTVTLEATDDSGVVIRSESFTVTQPVTFASIVGRVVEFRDELTKDGYVVLD